MDRSPASRPLSLSAYLPRLGLTALFVCLASGLVLAFQYRPFGNVFQNVEEITTRIPFGWFFRRLHHASGQVFVILMLGHATDHFVRKRYRLYPGKEWSRLTAAVCLCFFILFTGFILKGDQEGIFAGRIFGNLLGRVPLIGGPAQRLFSTEGAGFFFLPYLYHAFFAPLLVMFLLRSHIREWMPNQKALCVALPGLFGYALLVPSPMDIPPGAQAAVVKGPWFFLGIQSLLKTLDPVLAGAVLPALFVGGVLLLPASGRAGRPLHYAIVLVSCLYALLTLRSALWGP
ncbi:MAG: hypothetical protein DRH56_10215 [Deltaproteobacteria bacterium]|nr:MAG: hypothetical protein DRH56_10215 [Deltaproteobacteria bacterium]